MDSDQPEGYYTSTQQPFHRSKVRDYVHPNHVVEVDGQLWVTSLLRQSVVSAPTWETLFRSGAGLHDGVVEGDEIWVTRVDGVVEARCLRSPARCRARWDVSKPSGVSGWCRGLHVTRTHMWVGFTAMRRAARLPWSVGALEETQTAVVLMDHSNGVPVRSFRMPGERHTKVFSILEAP